MAKKSEAYKLIEVESYRPDSTSGLHGEVHIRPLDGQDFDKNLHVECSKSLSNTNLYPIGSRFRIRAKLTDRKGGGEYLYSFHGWDFEVVSLD